MMPEVAHQDTSWTKKTSWTSDLRVLRQMVLHRTKGRTHQDRLESFYGNQASDYDSFRGRLLHGRGRLIDKLTFAEKGVWVDLGCGTGSNVDLAGVKAERLDQIHLVDLTPSLLDIARHRFTVEPADASNQRSVDAATKITCHLADATRFHELDRPADVVTFSYSLTMIPDWFAAIENAYQLLRPGGIIGVTDFYVSRKHVDASHVHHGAIARAFWHHWFAMDNVFLHGDCLAMLQRKFEPVEKWESRGKVPYVPFLRAPYYVFVGRKR